MQKFDSEINKISEYCYSTQTFTDEVKLQAIYALKDAMSCVILALNNPYCKQHITPYFSNFSISDTATIKGINIPGTSHKLDLFQSSYVFSVLIRWLDFNDTWLAKEWGHPSDNLGTLITTMVFFSQQHNNNYTIDDLLDAIIRAYEIQGILALDNSFNEAGYDHVILVKLASTALTCKILGGTKQQCNNALSNAFLDGATLRTYRHEPNTGWRKSWAAGNACRQAIQHAFNAVNNEMGYPGALTQSEWGFNHIILDDKPLNTQQEYTDYVIRNILYKISFPIEFHAQTAVECAIKLHKTFKDKYNCNINKIETITIYTHKAAMRIINKTGKLNNPADRDHCIQYGVSVALLNGHLKSEMFTDEFSRTRDIDILRNKIIILEDNDFTDMYYDKDKRAIANRISIQYLDTQIDTMEILYPLGHKKRRAEALPILDKKFEDSIQQHFSTDSAKKIINSFSDTKKLKSISVVNWLSLWIKNEN